jgi:hypothetical protein
MTMAELPREAEKLLAVAPSDFVSARKRLVGELRDAGRSEEAEAVAGLKKPTAVVLAVNRAARDRSQAAKAAAEAAQRVEKAQTEGDADAFRAALADLDSALDLLSEVAVAHVAPRGATATDAMRRRVHDLLRRAAADPETRKALTRGALVEEQEATGFSPFAGTPPKSGRAAGARTAARPMTRQEEQRKERVKALRAELKEAERELDAAQRGERDAVRTREKAERAVESLRTKLERLG